MPSICVRMCPRWCGFVLLAVALTGCQPASDVLPPAGSTLGLSKVHVDEQRATIATVSGEDGGVITATDAGGAIFTLTIPEGALENDAEIGIFPVTSIDSLPLAVGVLAGVHLTPEGLLLHSPATLTIELPTDPDPAQLVGIAYEGDGQELQLYPTSLDGRKVTFEIVHFSGYDVGIAPLNELINRFTPTRAGAFGQSQLVLAFASARSSGGDPGADYARILHTWYVASVQPGLQRGGSEPSLPGVDFDHTAADYDAWISAVKFAILTSGAFASASDPDGAEAKTLSIAMVRNEIRLRNERCALFHEGNPNTFTFSGTGGGPDGNPVYHAARALGAQAAGQRWGIATTANQLTLEAVLDSLCVKLVIESATLPSGLSDGQRGNLHVKAGITIAGGPIRHDVTIKLRIDQNGVTSTVSPAQGLTNASGEFDTSVLWPSGLTELKVNILASLSQSVAPVTARIRRFEQVRRTSDENSAVEMITDSQTRGFCQHGTLVAICSLANARLTWSATGGVTLGADEPADDVGVSIIGYHAGRTAGTFQVTARSIQDSTQSATATIIVDDFDGAWINLTTVPLPVIRIDVNLQLDGTYLVRMSGQPNADFFVTRSGDNFTGPGATVGFQNLVITGLISGDQVTGDLFSDGNSLGNFTLTRICDNP